MRAVRFDRRTGGYAVSDVPRPRPAAGEVLIRVGAAGVGRIDVDLLRSQFVPKQGIRGDVTPGHEVAGTVAAPGAGVDGWPLGRRVAVHPFTPRPPGSPGAERMLGIDRDGGWADYVVTPASTLVPIPDDLSFAHAAVLTSAVAVPWSALTGPAGPRPGESVGIWGAGGLGVHAVQLARLVGAAPVIAVDPAAAARARAVRAGADLALDPAAPDLDASLHAATRGALLDVALDFSGVGTAQQQMIGALADKGRAVLAGLSGSPLGGTDATEFALSGRWIVGHGGSRVTDLARLVRLVELGRVDLSSSVDAVLPLEGVSDAVRRVVEEPGATARVVLRPRPAAPRHY